MRLQPFLFFLLVIVLGGCQDKACSENIHIMHKGEADYVCPRGTSVSIQSTDDAGNNTVICKCSMFLR